MENMEEKHIQQLLERFMKGVSTLEEERVLADYFRRHQRVKPEWADYKLLFDYINSGMPAEGGSVVTKSPHRQRLVGWLVGATAVAAAVVLAFLLLQPDVKDGNDLPKVAQRVLPRKTEPKIPKVAEEQPQNADPFIPTAAAENGTQDEETYATVSDATKALPNDADVPMDSTDNGRMLDEQTLQEMLLAHVDEETNREIDSALQCVFQQRRELIAAMNALPQVDDFIENFAREELVVAFVPM